MQIDNDILLVRSARHHSCMQATHVMSWMLRSEHLAFTSAACNDRLHADRQVLWV